MAPAAPKSTGAAVPAVEPLRLPVKDQRVNDLLLWREPIKSGVALLAVTAAYAVLTFVKYNPIVALCNALLVVIVASFIWNSYAKFAKKEPMPVPAVLKHGLTEEEAKAAAEKATVYVNKALAFLKRLFLASEPMATAQTAGVLYGIARVAAVVSPLTVAYTLAVLAFTLPKIYELRRHQIDQAVSVARTQATKLYDQYLRRFVSQIPRAANTVPIVEALEKKEE